MVAFQGIKEIKGRGGCPRFLVAIYFVALVIGEPEDLYSFPRYDIANLVRFRIAFLIRIGNQVPKKYFFLCARVINKQFLAIGSILLLLHSGANNSLGKDFRFISDCLNVS